MDTTSLTICEYGNFLGKEALFLFSYGKDDMEVNCNCLKLGLDIEPRINAIQFQGYLEAC